MRVSRVTPLFFASLLALSCSVQVDHSQTVYSCERDSICPTGRVCEDGVCVAPGGEEGVPDASDIDAAPPQRIEVPIAASSDDAEELVAVTTVSLTSSDLEMAIETDGKQLVGLRFAPVPVPNGAVVLSAKIQFIVDETSAGEAAIEIRSQLSAAPETFTTEAANISARALSEESVKWVVPQWSQIDDAGEDQATPDLVSLVQPIVERDDWSSGNALVFVLTGEGTRTAKSFDLDPNSVAVLHLEVQ